MDGLKIIDIKFPRVNYDNGIYKMTSRMIKLYTDDVENFVVESIIEMLPDDVTKILLLDKEKITEIFLKQTQVSRNVKDGKYYCPKCDTEMKKSGFCIKCGQKLY